MFKYRSSRRGFTLIELLVVISIIGTLSTVVLAALNSSRAKGRDASRFSQAKELVKALEIYYLEHGQYPYDSYNNADAATLEEMDGDGTGDRAATFDRLWDDGYIARIPADTTFGKNTAGYQYCSSDNDSTDNLGTYYLFIPLESINGEYCYFSNGPVDTECTANSARADTNPAVPCTSL